MDFESGIEQWLRSPDRVMGFVFLSFTLIAPVQFKLLQKNSSKRWNKLIIMKRGKGFFYREIESIR